MTEIEGDKAARRPEAASGPVCRRRRRPATEMAGGVTDARFDPAIQTVRGRAITAVLAVALHRNPLWLSCLEFALVSLAFSPENR
jgi:hypothetical protein